jgi:hypothetical protein
MMKRLRDQHPRGVDRAARRARLRPRDGALPLRRAIQRFIEDPLADCALGRELSPGATIVVDRRHGEIAEGESEVDIRIVEGVAPVAEKVTVPAEPPDVAEAQTEE